MSADPDKIYSSANLQDMNDDFLSARLAEVFPDGPPAAADVAAHDEYARQQEALFTEMMAVNPGSPRAQALQAQHEALLQGRFPDAAAPDPHAALRVSRPADAAQQQTEIYAELAKVNPGSPRAKELQASLESLLKQTYPDGSPEESPEPTPAADEPGAGLDTLEFHADTPEPVQAAYKTSAVELGVPWSEAQAVLDRLQRAHWLPADQFHATMRAEWGDAYENNLARAARELETLPGPLKEHVYVHMADDTVFSPELARELVNLPTLRGRGRRG